MAYTFTVCKTKKSGDLESFVESEKQGRPEMSQKALEMLIPARSKSPRKACSHAFDVTVCREGLRDGMA